MATSEQSVTPPGTVQLRRNVLNAGEVLGQSIANDGPSLAVATGVALVATHAGGGSTVVFIAATVAVVLVALSIAQFARRHAGSGSLYEFVARALGRPTGFLVGWSQMLGYVCGAVFAALGFYVYGVALFADAHHDLSGRGWGVLFCVVAAVVAGALAYGSVRLSTRVELVLEVLSLIAISVLTVVVLVKHGAHFDSSQFKLGHFKLHDLALGFPLAILSFVGFESSASLGIEAKNPRRSIPRSVIGSAVGIGLFFIVLSYVQIVGFSSKGKDVAASTAPLNDLANAYGLSGIGQILSAGIMISALGIAIACLNAASRIALTMSGDGLLPAVFARVHPTHRTPYVGVLTGAAVVAVLPSVLLLDHHDPFALLNDVGTLTALGLLVAYFAVCVAVPRLLAVEARLSVLPVVVAVLGALAVFGMVFGQVYPLPPSPIDYVELGFALFLGLGVVTYAGIAYAHRELLEQATPPLVPAGALLAGGESSSL